MNLSDASLLLTRPKPASHRFATQVEAALGPARRVVISPLLKIVPLAFEIPPANAEFAFTSENGVKMLANRIAPAGRRAWCVGARTAAKARAAGFDAQVGSGNVAALAALLADSGVSAPIVHIAGRHRRGDLAVCLRDAGLVARTVEAYDQQALPLSPEARDLLSAAGDVIAPVFSPRTTRLLSEAAAERRASLHLAAISPAAAEPWVARPGERVGIAPAPDTAGVLAAMGRLFDADRSA